MVLCGGGVPSLSSRLPSTYCAPGCALCAGGRGGQRETLCPRRGPSGEQKEEAKRTAERDAQGVRPGAAERRARQGWQRAGRVAARGPVCRFLANRGGGRGLRGCGGQGGQDGRTGRGRGRTLRTPGRWAGWCRRRGVPGVRPGLGQQGACRGGRESVLSVRPEPLEGGALGRQGSRSGMGRCSPSRGSGTQPVRLSGFRSSTPGSWPCLHCTATGAALLWGRPTFSHGLCDNTGPVPPGH